MSILEVRDLKKVYTSRFGTQQVEALRGLPEEFITDGV